jgi:hypothetical protein
MVSAELVVISVSIAAMAVCIVMLSRRLMACNQIVCGMAKTFADHVVSVSTDAREMKRITLETDSAELLLRETRSAAKARTYAHENGTVNGADPDYEVTAGIVDN